VFRIFGARKAFDAKLMVVEKTKLYMLGIGDVAWRDTLNPGTPLTTLSELRSHNALVGLVSNLHVDGPWPIFEPPNIRDRSFIVSKFVSHSHPGLWIHADCCFRVVIVTGLSWRSSAATILRVGRWAKKLGGKVVMAH